MRCLKTLSLTLALIAGLATVSSARAEDEQTGFAFGGFAFSGDVADLEELRTGRLNILSDRPSGTEDMTVVEAEFRGGQKVSVVRPLTGAPLDQGDLAVAGIYADIRRGSWVFTPSGALGSFRAPVSGAEDETSVQLNLGFETAYEFDNEARLGVRLSHTSSAWSDDRDPGSESALVTFTYPLSLFDD